MHFKKHLFVFIFLILCLFLCTSCLPLSQTEIPVFNNDSNVSGDLNDKTDDNTDNTFFEVHFIDVGQADAALILCDGKSMMIDGGNAEDSNLIYSYLKKNEISHLDYVIGTHAHEDHIGGLSGALNYATAGKVFCPTDNYDSNAFNNFKKYVEGRGTSIVIPDSSESFDLGSAKVNIIACNSDNDTNETSIVLKITYENTSFLFTGDAERITEQKILDSGYDISSTVLKVGHHGSESSTTYPFLREIMPEYAVISVGTDNSYGHPTEQVLSRLRDAGVKLFRTDLQGDIICKSDGETVTFSVSKNESINTFDPLTAHTNPNTSTIPDNNQPVPDKTNNTADYVLNTNSKKFHYEYCASTEKIKEENKSFFNGTRDQLILDGYSPCGNCDP